MILENLNTEQKVAVTLKSLHTLILAGAGSGKTKVLINRIAWLIQHMKIDPCRILAVTFTNKAAYEMIRRLSETIKIYDNKRLWIGTFHSLSNRFLRIHCQEAKLNQSFSILDDSDQLAVIKRLLKSKNINTDKYPVRAVQKFININKESGLRSSSLDKLGNQKKFLIEIYQAYEEQCQRESIVDFPELLFRTYETLIKNHSLCEYYQDRFQHILVDEFQDTNSLQYKWLLLLSKGKNAIFAVGDDDQSIYSFRGANNNVANFKHHYANNIIRLEQNYRSFGHILGAANSVIQHNNERLGKKLWTQRGDGEYIKIAEQINESMEAQWLVDEIKFLIKEKHNLKEIAILYRSNAQSRILENTFFINSIPYRVYGGMRFFERQEIKNALSYLRLIVNSNDDASLIRIINFPTRGIGARSLEKLMEISRQYNISLYQAIHFFSGKGKSNFLKFIQLIEHLKQETQKLSLLELVKYVLEYSGLISYYKSVHECTERLENLKELVTSAAIFSNNKESEIQPILSSKNQINSLLVSFLDHAALESGDNQINQDQSAVQLMTVHAAKGLEFDTVFITGLEEGLFPHENSLASNKSVEEERRLMYVAITRARKKLYMTFSTNRTLYGQLRQAKCSRFLLEIPKIHTKYLKSQQIKSYQNHRSLHDGYNNSENYQISKKIQNNLYKLKRVEIGSQIFQVGQKINHAHFGYGTIVALNGINQEIKAIIEFRNIGIKTIALSIAKLEII